MEKSDKVRILSHFSPSHEPFVILYLVLHFSEVWKCGKVRQSKDIVPQEYRQEYSLVELKHPRHCMRWALFPTATTLGNPALVMQIGSRRLHGCDQTGDLTR